MDSINKNQQEKHHENSNQTAAVKKIKIQG